MSARGDLRKLLKDKEQDGWDVEQTSANHLKLRHRFTGAVVIGGMKARPRDLRNLEAELRKVERAGQNPKKSCYS